jgi:hypothetical protein
VRQSKALPDTIRPDTPLRLSVTGAVRFIRFVHLGSGDGNGVSPPRGVAS